MKVLVTGASGFIGRNFLDYLKLVTDLEVFVLSLNASSFDKYIWSNVTFIELKSDLSNMKEKLHQIKPEILVHLGWKGIPDYSINNSLDNVIWSVDLVRAAIGSGVKRVISTGSCWEYLEPTGAVDEEWPIDRGNAFKLAKSSVREFISLMCSEAEVEFVWLRLFYVYGYYQNRHSLIPSLIHQLKLNVAPYANNPNPRVDFINASYVSEILYQCIKKRALEGIFNLGSGTSTRVLDVVNTLRGIYNYPLLSIEAEINALNFYSSNYKVNQLTKMPAPNILEDIEDLSKGMRS